MLNKIICINSICNFIILATILTISNVSFAGENEAIKNAQENKITDQSSAMFGCMLQEWEANIVPEKSNLDEGIEVWEVFAYERFLACYRSNSSEGTGAVGELGVDTEKRRVPNGTRFRAEVICSNNICRTEWIDTTCCFNMEHEQY